MRVPPDGRLGRLPREARKVLASRSSRKSYVRRDRRTIGSSIRPIMFEIKARCQRLSCSRIWAVLPGSSTSGDRIAIGIHRIKRTSIAVIGMNDVTGVSRPVQRQKIE
jgi:hypothetical protein